MPASLQNTNHITLVSNSRAGGARLCMQRPTNMKCGNELQGTNGKACICMWACRPSTTRGPLGHRSQKLPGKKSDQESSQNWESRWTRGKGGPTIIPWRYNKDALGFWIWGSRDVRCWCGTYLASCAFLQVSALSRLDSPSVMTIIRSGAFLLAPRDASNIFSRATQIPANPIQFLFSTLHRKTVTQISTK